MPSSHINSVKLIAVCYLIQLRISELSRFQEVISEGRQLTLLLTRIYTKSLEPMAANAACSSSAFPFIPDAAIHYIIV